MANNNNHNNHNQDQDQAGCELCLQPGGEVLWQDGLCRVIRVGGDEGDAFPGFCRVVWQAHIKEMSDLPATEQRHLWQIISATEIALRETLQPDKINLAALGNMVPHLHWHVIPRWRDDSHFPAPIWAAAQRPAPTRAGVDNARLKAALGQALANLESGA